jgi:FtsP/CotA-like multicopper oxidase with cupredoxin domain
VHLLLQACKTYVITVKNTMQGYTTPSVSNYNSYRDPYVTNLHTHGLHISGDAGADDVTVEIKGGKEYDYTYVIPCDHAGTLMLQLYTTYIQH